jgi:hypothetical protein
MARLSYSAPGVYVEEVPSARQPIAGVGTNTVAFIGIVPDTVYCPVANPRYDPVTARAMLTWRRAPEGSKDREVAAARKEIETRLLTLNAQVSGLEKDLAAATENVAEQTRTRDAAEKALNAVSLDADDAVRGDAMSDFGRAGLALEEALKKEKAAQDALNETRADIEALEQTAPGTAGTAGGAGAGTAAAPGAGTGGAAGGAAAAPKTSGYEEAYAAGEPPPDSLLRRSLLRPYYLVPFDIEVDEFATKLCTNFTEYTDRFGDFSAFGARPAGAQADDFRPLHPGHHFLTHAVNGFFKNGGTRCFVARVKSEAGLAKALERLESIDEVAIVAAPGLPKTPAVWGPLEDYCEDAAHLNVFAILDCPERVDDGKSDDLEIQRLRYDAPNSVLPRMSNHAAFYFPFIEVNDPAKRVQDEDPARDVAAKYRGLTHVPPSGHIAGIYARTDEERGVHKAPANAVVRGALEVKYYVSKPKQELLNPQGVNCLRIMNNAVVVWGARTLGGDRNGEWKYINVRRFAGYLEESIDEGTQWVVFEPNDPSLWSKIRLNVTAFLTNVWRNGALFGQTPEEAFYVKCDAELNPPEVRDLGQVVTEIGVAIVRPAEFVIFRISQFTNAQRS